MTDTVDSKRLLEVARESISAHLEGRPLHISSLTTQPKADGVFVTLTTITDELRGCIGRHCRLYPDSLEEEIAELAIAAATEDPRFNPVNCDELRELTIEISLLHSQEQIESPAELDAKRYGVIVKAGRRQGTLLPDIDGVDTVEQQIQIAKRKAGILPNEPVTLYRFAVTKIKALNTHE